MKKNIKRPLNAFFRYKRAIKDVIARKYNTQKNSEIAAICASMWEQESPDIKLFYAKETEQEFKEYRRLELLDVDMEFCTGFTPTIEQCEPILRYMSQCH